MPLTRLSGWRRDLLVSLVACALTVTVLIPVGGILLRRERPRQGRRHRPLGAGAAVLLVAALLLGGTGKLWGAATGQEALTLKGHTRPVFSVCFSPDGKRLAQHLWAHRDDLFTFLRQPGLDATNWRAELAIRFGVILRKVWGGSRTWSGARAQSVLMSVWRTCWQQGRSALDFLSQLLRGTPPALAIPP